MAGESARLLLILRLCARRDSLSANTMHSLQTFAQLILTVTVTLPLARAPAWRADHPGYTADKIGRKRTIQLGSVIAAVGCAIQAGAPNVGALIAGRFIAGVAIGVLSMIVPMYQVS
jgi:MFS family permease